MIAETQTAFHSVLFQTSTPIEPISEIWGGGDIDAIFDIADKSPSKSTVRYELLSELGGVVRKSIDATTAQFDVQKYGMRPTQTVIDYAVPFGRRNDRLSGDETAYSQPATKLHNTIQSKFINKLNELRSLLTGEQITAVSRQLIALLEDAEELAGHNIMPSRSSFSGLIVFLSRHKRLKHPNVALNQSGKFVASWREGRQRKLSITFCSLHSAEWLLVAIAENAINSTGEKFDVLANRLPEEALGWLVA